MTKVMVFGTFDILHPGHNHMLKEAKQYGEELIVVIARDDNVKKAKGRLPKNNEKQRLTNLKKLKLTDKICLGNLHNKYKIIDEEKPDIIALGYDQKTYVDDLTDHIDNNVQIVRLAPYKPEIYKSSKLRYEVL